MLMTAGPSGIRTDDVEDDLAALTSGGRSAPKFVVVRIPPPYTKFKVSKRGEAGDSFASFANEVVQDDVTCAIGLYRMTFHTMQEGSREGLISVIWCPRDSSVRDRMVYAAGLRALRSYHTAVEHAHIIQANEEAEVTIREIVYFVLAEASLFPVWSPDTHPLFSEEFQRQLECLFRVWVAGEHAISALPFELFSYIAEIMQPELAQ